MRELSQTLDSALTWYIRLFNDLRPMYAAQAATYERWANAVEGDKGAIVSTVLIDVVTPAIGMLAMRIAVATPVKSLAKDMVGSPSMIWGKSAEEIAKDFKAAGYDATIRQSTRGSGRAIIVEIKGHPEVCQIQVHPGVGRHEGAYVKISTTSSGVIKVVDLTYKATPGERATIHQQG